ncbi:energy transducer TonB [Adhaeribacter sp. BT258]|uniref:Energy transducer TonB n=1 Tax=Adhaeribacter terrigena TaxID=2793070 RepID=A0ABS1BY49_9BACT|nr:energy transducer TonB [Adhaeribacter terrigena]MBK0402087.1 energy transducer TonB [Adhaeribacter terrigena]
MKQSLFVWFILLSCNFVALPQATKHVIVKFKGSKEVFESYSVLKSNKNIKHGEYVAYFKPTDFNHSHPENLDFFIRIRGNFLNGKKNGEWVEYSEPSIIKSKGNYQKDKKIGVWKTRRENGQVIERYDYTNKKYLNPEIRADINYPETAAKKNIEGKVKIGYKIQPDCLITDILIIKSLSPECDKAAIDAITRLGEYSKKYGYPCEPGAQERTFNFSIQ